MILSLCSEDEINAIIDTWEPPEGFVKVVVMTRCDDDDLAVEQPWRSPIMGDEYEFDTITDEFICVEGKTEIVPKALAELLYEDQARNPDGEWQILAA